MHPQQPQKPLFRFSFPARSGHLQRLARLAASCIETILALDVINDVHARAAAGRPDPFQFCGRALDAQRIRWHVSEEDLGRIPRTGPLVVVANHPFGAAEGMVLPALLGQVRRDVLVLANFILGRIPELRDLFILVDPFAGRRSTSANIAPVRQCIRHLRNGGVLGVFPAGEVASLDLRRREVIDPPWLTTAARIVKITKAPVLPVFFPGRNSVLFQLLGLVHPRLRTAMLAREFANKTGKKIEPRIGSVIPFKRISSFDTDQQLSEYLRRRTYLLQHRISPLPAGDRPRAAPNQQPIIAPVDPTLLAADVAALPLTQVLVDADDMLVCQARAHQIPHVLRELGRLREIAFRATGEGTGRACDIDRFDDDYIHLFVWNKARGEVVGAYRLGPTDEILQARGRSGLYTTTLFKCRMRLLCCINPALELGRSFVREEYQKSFSPLMLLWKGIGQFVAGNPRYRYLFGPVSISNTYQSVSKQLMVSFLRAHHGTPEMVDLVQPRHPFRISRVAGWDRSAVHLIRDSEDVSDLVCDLEPEQKGIPVLLRQYLKLGAKLLAFNVDPSFAECVDALMVCDLSKTDTRMLDRYMGKDGRARFLQYHADRARAAPRINAVMT